MDLLKERQSSKIFYYSKVQQHPSNPPNIINQKSQHHQHHQHHQTWALFIFNEKPKRQHCSSSKEKTKTHGPVI
jgi:hypothetical protein